MALGDEASESALITNEIPMGKIIKSIDPSIRLIQNSSAVVGDPQLAKDFYNVFDIFQPAFPEFKSNQYLNEWLRGAGKPIWTYKCSCDLNQKGRNLYEYYRVYAWDVLKEKLSGMGVWTY